jgi:hypothetical protein
MLEAGSKFDSIVFGCWLPIKPTVSQNNASSFKVATGVLILSSPEDDRFWTFVSSIVCLRAPLKSGVIHRESMEGNHNAKCVK